MISRKSGRLAARRLAPGQIWRLEHVYIQIVGQGEQLLEYRMMDTLHEPGARTQVSGIDTMWGYLRSRQARLVRPGISSRGVGGGSN